MILQPVDDIPSLETFPGTLSEGGMPEDVYIRPPVAPVTALSQTEVQALLQRLEPLPAEDDDEQEFALRPGSRPPPRTGETVLGEFPSSDERAPPTVEAPEGPLQVLRFSPEGEVPLAGQVSVTFDRPMVDVASHTDAVEQWSAVEMSPWPAGGAWRWVGTRTLVFEPEGPRLPMATDYSLVIPAGAYAPDGAVLEQELRWTFSTPPATLTAFYPSGSRNPLNPLIFIEFDQRIDAQAMLASIRVDGGGSVVPTRLAQATEITANETVSRLVEQAEADHWLVLRPERDLPYDNEIQVTVIAGAPSAEGPRLTGEDQTRKFRTYGPFVVEAHRCGWRDDRCEPDAPLRLSLSNALADEQSVQELVEITPDVAGLEIQAWGSGLSITGWKNPRTRYTVRLSPDLTDEFGQKLSGPREFTFDVGSAPPKLAAAQGPHMLLDPAAEPMFEFYTLNYAQARIAVHQVSPHDWPAYLRTLREVRRDGDAGAALPGETVFDKSVALEGGADEVARTAFDLKPFLNESGLGHLILVVEATKPVAGAVAPRYPERAIVWVQSTRIGLDTYTDAEETLVWATDLLTGQPRPDVEISLPGIDQRALSDDQGLVRFALGGTPSPWLEARAGDDLAMLPGSRHDPEGSWKRGAPSDSTRWFVFDDRAIYRPGEHVHLKGWLRLIENRKGGDIRLLTEPGALHFEVFDSRNNQLAEGEVQVSALGGFDLTFELPDTPNLGTARVELRNVANRSSYSYRHHFQIEEFRTPEFEVTARVPEGPFFAGEQVTATASAQYYAGGPLPGAETNWHLAATTAHYAPPNHPGWEFGIGFPRWWWPVPEQSVTDEFSGVTDAGGEHHLDIVFDRHEVSRPLALTAQASVTDVNRQVWTASAHWLVHPARDYVGLKTESYFVERGEPLEMAVLVADVDGQARPGRPVKVAAGRIKGHAWDDEGEIDHVQECEVRTDAQGLGHCSFETQAGGRWRITATVMDDEGRRNVTRITRWVSGGPLLPSAKRVEIERAELIPDADEYAPGDTARVLVNSPFENAQGLMLINRQGMVEQRHFEVDGTTATLEIPVRHDWLPNVQLQVTLLGQAPRGIDEDVELPPRPAIASGQLDIPVSVAERVLDVAVAPRVEKLAPGEETGVSITIRDHAGGPVAEAEVALVVVDEAILALTRYALSDPMEVFYALRSPGTQTRHGRSDLILASLDALLDEPTPPPSPAPMDGTDKIAVTGTRVMRAAQDAEMEGVLAFDLAESADGDQPIAIRTDFNPLAAFVPALTTDRQGRATATISLPDNLTRYRIMAVAVEGATRYGTGESALTARLPLMVRPSPPRFLNFGDAFEFPVVLQNQTDEPLSVAVALDTANLELEAQGWRAEVPPNDRVEVRFPARTVNAGTARFQIAAQAGSFTDAARGRLPVWTPATSEAFATYGVIDEGAMVQPVSAPTEVWPQFGQLEITASSTAVQSLTDAFIYLQNYPFECTEQVASRVLSVAALRDVLSAFEAEGLPEPEDIETGMSRDLELLTNRQNPDGGFALWRRGERSWPYVTLHVAHALVRARGKGYAVPAALWDSTWRHIRDIERYIPDHYGDWARRHIVAYSLYVRALGGDRDDARARALLAEVDDLSELSFESLGWLLGVLSPDSDSAREVAELRRYLGNRVTETAAGATFASAYSQPDGYLIMHSSRRADGIVLEALIDDQPDSDLIPKIVHALQAHRTRGRWGNTQENAFVLLALDKYFNRFEDQTPDFVARAWLGESFAGEHAFRGRTTERYHLDIPMSAVARDGGRHDLILDKDGAGRMYYRVGLRYAPRSLELEPAAHGFEVQRRYLAVDDEDDVKQRDDGVWEIRAGARVKIELDLVAPARRHHVALIDPLPAGLEAINPALAVSAPPGNDNGQPIPLRGRGFWWWGPWYEHQNLRDERAEAFASLLPGGVYSYSYYARATTPGEYVVPPARAEEMYEPETFGRSGTDRVVVVER